MGRRRQKIVKGRIDNGLPPIPRAARSDVLEHGMERRVGFRPAQP